MTRLQAHRSTCWSRHRRLVCGLLLGLVVGCSAESRYKTLSVFFEGVPPPIGPATRVAAGGVPQAVRSSHEPFLKKNCAACHATNSGSDDRTLAVLRPGLCVDCHPAVTRQPAVVHAPVALGQCLWCHGPHESGEVSLLREKAPNLCFQCHPQTLLSSNPKEHQDGKSACLACHIGHGGSDRRMLRHEPVVIGSPARGEIGGTP